MHVKISLLPFLLLVFCSALQANTLPEKLELPHIHQRVGYHGMVLFTNGIEIYASHLPLYQPPHDYQLIYQLAIENKALFIKLLTNNMLTILPEKFDLNRLVNGEVFDINANIYQGHFERDAVLIASNAKLTFKQRVYKKRINYKHTAVGDKQNQTHFAPLTELNTLYSKNNFLVHVIQGAPSFDAIIEVIDNTCSSNVGTDLETITVEVNQGNVSENILKNALSHCGIIKVHYLEIQDFIK